MLNEEELKDAALLVFANKQDQPGAKGAGDISQALRLGELRDRNWSIMACSAVDGSGVSEGMDWLVVSYCLRCCKIAQQNANLADSKPSPRSRKTTSSKAPEAPTYAPLFSAHSPWLIDTRLGRRGGMLSSAAALSGGRGSIF